MICCTDMCDSESYWLWWFSDFSSYFLFSWMDHQMPIGLYLLWWSLKFLSRAIIRSKVKVCPTFWFITKYLRLRHSHHPQLYLCFSNNNRNKKTKYCTNYIMILTQIHIPFSTTTCISLVLVYQTHSCHICDSSFF